MAVTSGIDTYFDHRLILGLKSLFSKLSNFSPSLNENYGGVRGVLLLAFCPCAPDSFY